MLGVHSAVSTGGVDTVCWADKTYDKGRTSEIKLSTIQQTTAKEKAVYLNWIVCRGKKGLLGEQELLVVSNLMMKTEGSENQRVFTSSFNNLSYTVSMWSLHIQPAVTFNVFCNNKARFSVLNAEN